LNRPTCKECYTNGLRKWFGCFIKEPHAIFKGSLLAWLCHLPIISYGPAQLTVCYYIGRRCDGYITSWREAVDFGFGLSDSKLRLKAWLMGLSDALALLLAVGSGYALLEIEVALPLPFQIIYGMVLLIDLIYLASGIYRYPALVCEPDNKLSLLILRGILLSLGSFWWTFLFLCFHLIWFMLCVATGVGVLLLYPAGAALLSYCAYTEMIQHFIE